MLTTLQHYHFLNHVLHSIRLLRKYPRTFSSSHDHKWSRYVTRLDTIFSLYKSIFSVVPVLPLTLSSCQSDNFNQLFATLSHASKSLRGLHLLKEKEFQDSSIKAHIDTHDQNFDTDISSFINSALSYSRHQIVLDRVFIDYPTAPQLLTDPKDISDAVPHEWRCQLKNTRPITLLEVIQKSFIKLFYNRLSSILATHNILISGNFAGLPGGTCHDPIITLESIIHNANHNNSPLWILSQDISKAFDSVNLIMLKFALERIYLPASAIMLILSLFMNRSNRVFMTHSDTSSYQVRIGIDQGEVISSLLWVIYIDPLLTVLKKKMMDPYILRSLTLLPIRTHDPSNIEINNLVFIDDSTLISSSKAGLEHMLSITEEFYTLNNTLANHQKYVLISNSLHLTTTSTISSVDFNLELSPLNRVWFNIKGSWDFVKKQIAGECNSFAATLRLARLSAKQVVYLYTTMLIPKLEYRMQVTHLSEKDCYTAMRLIRSLVKQKANFSYSFPNSILYLSQALGLINLFSYMIQCYVTNLFLMANSSTPLVQPDKCGRSLSHKWYLDIKANTTLPDSHDRLYDRYVSSPSTPFAIDLIPVHWISDCLSFSGDVIRLYSCPGCDAHIPFPLANKYTAVTPSCTFKISLLKSLILPTNCERIRQNTSEVISSYFWADLNDTVVSYYRHLDILPDLSSLPPVDDGVSLQPSPLCDLTRLPSPIIHDAGYLNSVATYTHGIIQNWPSSTRAEAAAIYAVLSVSLADSTISIYTDSQAAIDRLRLCVSSSYTNNRLYYKTTNFELWASIERSIHAKRLTVYPVKVKGHDGNY
ncbi:RNA-directed DNA polymerase from mobile element jockey-like [Rhizophagus clarus]|uniref:RNA-directed DNA polymerase from mobile element jockey-like n=1 Tax=Rhizophagus clarus TaxID=94130 RepID=A0A8H3LAW6_9GLOM|nr:RNA-directed DNA polymerase from mobile element jockey-like [Rhizophagus clarus]